jgi:hypothetical protein
MEVKEFADKVISIKNKKLTDEVFLLVQNDHELMKEYLELVHLHGVQAVNSQIGKQVAQRYGLTKDEGRNHEPESTLILSHQVF